MDLRLVDLTRLEEGLPEEERETGLVGPERQRPPAFSGGREPMPCVALGRGERQTVSGIVGIETDGPGQRPDSLLRRQAGGHRLFEDLCRFGQPVFGTAEAGLLLWGRPA